MAGPGARVDLSSRRDPDQGRGAHSGPALEQRFQARADVGYVSFLQAGKLTHGASRSLPGERPAMTFVSELGPGLFGCEPDRFVVRFRRGCRPDDRSAVERAALGEVHVAGVRAGELIGYAEARGKYNSETAFFGRFAYRGVFG